MGVEKRIELDDVAAKAVVGTFQCQMQITQGRSITVTGHLYDSDSPEAVNRRIDVYQDALDRQYARCDIVNKEMQRKAMLGAIEQVKEQLEAFKARQDGRIHSGLSADAPRPLKLSSQEKLALQNGDQQIKTILGNIEKLDKDILEGRKKLGMAV